MPKTTFGSGTLVTPEFLNAINNPVFDGQNLDGHYPRLTDADLSDAPGQVKARLMALEGELRVTPSVGLYVSVAAGRAAFGVSVIEVQAQSVAAPNNAVSWVYVDATGQAIASTLAPTSGLVLAQVTTSSGAIVSVADKRSRWSIAGAGGSGGGSGAPIAPVPGGGLADGISLVWNAATNQFEAGLPTIPLENVDGMPSLAGQGGKFLRIATSGDALEAAAAAALGGGANKCTLFLPRSRTVSLGQVVTSATPPTGATGGAPIMPQFNGSNTRTHPDTGEVITVSASTQYGSAFAPWVAFDRSVTSDCWATLAGDTSPFISVLFAVSKSIGSYSLTAPSFARDMPTSWLFQGSNDGATWVTLHTVANEPAWASQETRIYVPTTVSPYLRYRLSISLQSGISFATIREIQFFTPTSSGALVTRFTPGEVRAISTQRLYSICAADSGTVFAATGRDTGGDALTRIDAASLATVGQVALASDLYALQYGLLSSDRQFLYDIIATDGTGALAYNPGLGRVYTAIGSRILVTDLVNNTSSTIVLEERATAAVVQGITLHSGRIYASIGNLVKVYNASSNAFITDIPVGTDARLMGLDAGRSLLFVANFGGNTVTVVSTDTNAAVTTINVGQGPTDVTASNALARAIACNSQGGSVTIINTTSNTATGGVTIGVGSEPTEAAIAPSGKAYVACRGYNQVAVIDLMTATLLKRIPCDPGPQNVVYEPGSNRILVGCEVGTVQAFEAE